MKPLVLFATLLALPYFLRAADKESYTLFNPVPREEMRELSTDRPDKTESPYTVDAGHFQIESDLVNWTHDIENGTELDALAIGAVNLRVGLTQNLEFNVILEPYHYERTRTRGRRDTDDGFGDLTLRGKLNLWGNDGGSTALGVLPFVTLPTASGDFGADRTEAGIILPLSIELAEGWNLGLMTEVDFVSEDDGGHTTHVINSVTVSHDLTDKLGVYLEFFSEIPTEDTSAWEGTVDVGFTFALTDNVQLDAGANFGVTDAADDINPFVGVTVRF